MAEDRVIIERAEEFKKDVLPFLDSAERVQYTIRDNKEVKHGNK